MDDLYSVLNSSKKLLEGLIKQAEELESNLSKNNENIEEYTIKVKQFEDIIASVNKISENLISNSSNEFDNCSDNSKHEKNDNLKEINNSDISITIQNANSELNDDDIFNDNKSKTKVSKNNYEKVDSKSTSYLESISANVIQSAKEKDDIQNNETNTNDDDENIKNIEHVPKENQKIAKNQSGINDKKEELDKNKLILNDEIQHAKEKEDILDDEINTNDYSEKNKNSEHVPKERQEIVKNPSGINKSKNENKLRLNDDKFVNKGNSKTNKSKNNEKKSKKNCFDSKSDKSDDIETETKSKNNIFDQFYESTTDNNDKDILKLSADENSVSSLSSLSVEEEINVNNKTSKIHKKSKQVHNSKVKSSSGIKSKKYTDKKSLNVFERFSDNFVDSDSDLVLNIDLDNSIENEEICDTLNKPVVLLTDLYVEKSIDIDKTSNKNICESNKSDNGVGNLIESNEDENEVIEELSEVKNADELNDMKSKEANKSIYSNEEILSKTSNECLDINNESSSEKILMISESKNNSNENELDLESNQVSDVDLDDKENEASDDNRKRKLESNHDETLAKVSKNSEDLDDSDKSILNIIESNPVELSDNNQNKDKYRNIFNLDIIKDYKYNKHVNNVYSKSNLELKSICDLKECSVVLYDISAHQPELKDRAYEIYLEEVDKHIENLSKIPIEIKKKPQKKYKKEQNTKKQSKKLKVADLFSSSDKDISDLNQESDCESENKSSDEENCLKFTDLGNRLLENTLSSTDQESNKDLSDNNLSTDSDTETKTKKTDKDMLRSGRNKDKKNNKKSNRLLDNLKMELGSDDDDDDDIKRSGKSSKKSDCKDDSIEITKVTSKRKAPIELSSESDSDCSITDIRKKAKLRKKGDAKEKKSKNTKGTKNGRQKKAPPKKAVEEDEEEGVETRKIIHKIMDKSKLSEATKTAAQLESERRKRIEERQQKYNGSILEECADKVLEISDLILEQDEEGNSIVDVHDEITKHLKPHQKEAIQFLYDCVIESVDTLDKSREKSEEKEKEEPKDDKPKSSAVGGCILAHCMGLGKTLSLIGFMHTMLTVERLNFHSCIVICPVNTALNWKKEWEMWVPESDPVDIYEMCSTENKRYKIEIINDWKKSGGVLIIGYEMFRLLASGDARMLRRKALRNKIYEALVDPGPDFVVCDEGHLLKNCKSGISKVVNKIKTLRRIVLTGTPLQNKLIEYHTMVNFVKPNLLGTNREFLNQFVNPITNGQHIDSTEYDVKLMKKRSHILFKTLDGCVHRRDYSALVKYLPAKYEYVLKIRLSEIQIKLYGEYLENFRDRSRNSLFRDHAALSRIWTHPYVICMHQELQNKKMVLEDSEGSFINDDDDDDAESIEYMEETDKKKKKEPKNEKSNKIISLCSDEDDEKNGINGEKDAGDDDKEESGDDDKSSDEEVVRNWKTRRLRGRKNALGDSDDDDKDQENGEKTEKNDNENNTYDEEKHWWSDIINAEHEHQIEISGKLVILFQILRKASDIGDKVILFSHSLLVLDIIEKYLMEMDKLQKTLAEELKQLGNLGLTNDMEKTNDGTTGDGDDNKEDDIHNLIKKENIQKMKSEFYSDVGYNSWIKGVDYERMDGSTLANTRADIQAKFNAEKDKRLRLFLISTRAGGIGINLVAANRVVIFDVSWNPSHDVQAIFRTYRFGQTKPVYVYRLVGQGCMEEKIYDRQVQKTSLALRVIDEQQITRHFTEEDLRSLYKFEPDVYDPEKPRETPILPKDRFLAELITDVPQWIYGYHEHDSLLQKQEDEELTEEERKEAWKEFEEEKRSGFRPNAILPGKGPGGVVYDHITAEGREIHRNFQNILNYYPAIAPIYAQNYQHLLSFVLSKKPELSLNPVLCSVEVKSVFLRSLSKLYGSIYNPTEQSSNPSTSASTPQDPSTLFKTIIPTATTAATNVINVNDDDDDDDDAVIIEKP